MIDISPVSKPFYDCFAVNIATVAKYYKYNYYLWFSNKLYFHKYIKEGIWDIMKTFHGITKEEGIFSDLSKFQSYVKFHIANCRPVIIRTDIFNCPWNKYYRIKHNLHYIQIIGMTGKNLICLDPFFTQAVTEMPVSELFSQDIYTLILNTAASNERADNALKFIRNYLTIYFDSIRSGELNTDKISNSLQYNNEPMLEEDIYNNLSVRQLTILDNHRSCYLEMLLAIDRQFSIGLSEYCNSIEDISLKLRRLRSKVVRNILGRSFVNEKKDHYQEISCIIKEEEMYVERFLEQIEYYLYKENQSTAQVHK